MKISSSSAAPRSKPTTFGMSELLIEDAHCVRTLALNRPEKRNALNNALTQALVSALAEADADDAVRCVLVTGRGSAFCAGADLSEFKDLSHHHMQRVQDRAELTMQLHLAFSRMGKPVIAAVNGPAMGGGAGLALACDLCVAADSATIGFPEISKGVVAAIVMANLVRQVGRKHAFMLVAGGITLRASRAAELGLFNQVVPDGTLMEEAASLAQRLASMSPMAMAATKRLFHEAADLPLEAALRAGRTVNEQMRDFKR